MIQPNLHKWDRLARGIIGVSVVCLVLFSEGYIQDPILEILLFVFGGLNLISLALGWCPVYSIAGLSTRPKETPDKKQLK